MLHIKSFIYLAVSIACCTACVPTKPDKQDARAEVGSVIQEIKAALSDVQTTLVNGDLPPLKEVKLSLKTELSKKAGGKISFFVVSMGGDWESTKAQSIDITLIPPKPGNPQLVATESVTQLLEDAIISAAKGVKDANEGIPLHFHSLSVSLNFTVKYDGSAGAKPTIEPVTIEASGSVTKSAVHALTVTFEEKEK